MHRLFKTLNGKTIKLDTDTYKTIAEIKRDIEKSDEIPFDKQKLMFNRKILENDKKLGDYNIFDKSIVQLLLSMKSN